MLNGVRGAIWAENWNKINTGDLYQTDEDRITEEDMKAERDALSDIFPTTLDDDG
jgi:hypothetical protein